MQRVNLITLKRGLNTICISHNDLGLESSTQPIAFLPAGTQIKSVLFDVKEKFRSTLPSNVIDPNAAIQYTCMIGTIDDSQTYLEFSSDIAKEYGKLNANTGTYFDSPLIKSIDTKIVLETWVTTRVWSMGGDLNTARSHLAGFGNRTAGVSAGGRNVTPVSVSTTEEYNGSSWSAGGSLNNVIRYNAGLGTLSAGLSFGGHDGSYQNRTEEYDGTIWSIGGTLNVARAYSAGCGTQSAGLSFGGALDPSSTVYDTCEEYNGASWSTSHDINTAKSRLAGAGTQTAGVCIGGSTTTTEVDTTEEYDGNVWSVENPLNVGRYNLYGGGVQSACMSFGGRTWSSAVNDNTEEYDGTNWIVSNDLNFLKSQSSGCHELSFGGYKTSADPYVWTEEYSTANLNEISLSGKMNITFLVT